MKAKILLFLLLLMGVFGCRVTWVPAYDAGLEEQITKTAKLNDALYLLMMEDQEADRKYKAYAAKYIDIELEINSIFLKTQARDHNKDLLVLVQNLQKLFTQFKIDHKTKGTLSNADIQLNQVQIKAMWTPLLISEKALKRQK
jgi:hypothetical protein